MNLSSFAVKRPVTITMMVLVVVIFGAISLAGLPIDLYPEIEIPVAIVSTSYSGAGPQEIENLITKRIEGAIATVGNIDTINSISSQGSSIVIAQFNTGTNMDFATLEMREKVDLVKGALPDDATQPMVIKIDPNSMPIVQIALSTNGSLSSLQSLAEDNFKQRFERLEGVASVDIGGGLTDEIEVSVDIARLSRYGLSINQLNQLLSAANTNLPGGVVENGEQDLTIRVIGEFNSIDEIRDMPITLNTGSIITLKDIAKVELKNKDITGISRTNGEDSINISIKKQSGKNTVQVADLVSREVEKLKKDYPDVKINIVIDTSTIIRDSINNVIDNVIVGSIFAIAVLYIFLKNIRSTLIVGVSIPISLIASFILLYFNKITLNMMTLGGLALAVGMLVDSAIVVLENIYRYRVEGYSKKEAAIKGAKEVGLSIMASTLTTIAVFLPIVFVDGMVGILFKDFAMTVTLSLTASLVVALTFIPMLSSKILTIDDTEGKKKRLDFIYKAFDNLFEKIENKYKSLLELGLKRRKTTIAISVIVFVLSVVSLAGVGMEFFPVTDEGSMTINISLPLGSNIYQVDEITKIVEEKITEIPEIDVIFANVTSGGFGSHSINTGNSGSISVNLVKLRERKRSTKEVAEEVRKITKDIPGAEITVTESSNMGMAGSSAPVSISIKGDELEVLEKISNDFKDIIESVEGTRDVKTSLSDAVPEVEIQVNKENAAIYGLTTSQIASAIRGGASGTIVAKYKDEGDELDIVVRATEDITESLSNLGQLDITTPSGINIPISQVADISIVKGPIQINREDQERVVTVTSQITGRDLRSISLDIEKEIKNYEFPSGYSYKIGGENEQMIDAFKQLLLALILAIILIYMVMAAQFESLINPFIIMFTIPLAFGGGLLGLFITRKSFGVTAFIGIIMLAGIVVNNGIVLIDYINTLRQEGKERFEAITTAGPIRLRPILMTTLTTILGLVPLALGIGEGAEMQAPMAVVVISGLTLSTVLTLVFVPVLYTVFDDFSIKMKSRIKRLRKSNSNV
ncbi:hydrophobic/amphiphilic exporter-1, HAE1 family [Tissierella praeacuta DSM 18095]|uniref:Hydrophobic/amphiphilic exporter-1, HAE1 family n=1 Tax=Tissierella praeacuta DSM 18095 TaxID=1123404 RepID=A0A1M4XT60_9FIRM|nr:efflux RND transporter permease subunit [Tissierella praeacuta]SHE96635.1 hydrophobic/amphiphilic exporter-1, HAE1 family [Tissierella praeacuta DSM 18095]SUO99181.1 Swarming motility protein SwrC [Tissierella praeacuta]